jgi:hypothetical protein
MKVFEVDLDLTLARAFHFSRSTSARAFHCLPIILEISGFDKPGFCSTTAAW